jgi:hypothetical protein
VAIRDVVELVQDSRCLEGLLLLVALFVARCLSLGTCRSGGERGVCRRGETGTVFFSRICLVMTYCDSPSLQIYEVVTTNEKILLSIYSPCV